MSAASLVTVFVFQRVSDVPDVSYAAAIIMIIIIVIIFSRTEATVLKPLLPYSAESAQRPSAGSELPTQTLYRHTEQRLALIRSPETYLLNILPRVCVCVLL